MADNIVLDEFNKLEIIRKFNDNLPKLNDNLSKLNDNLSKYNENLDNFKKQDLQLNQNLHLNLKDQIVRLQERVQILEVREVKDQIVRLQERVQILEVREVKDQIEKIQQKVQNLEQQNKMVQNKENYEDIVNLFDHFENRNFDSPLISDNFEDTEILSENLLNENPSESESYIDVFPNIESIEDTEDTENYFENFSRTSNESDVKESIEDIENSSEYLSSSNKDYAKSELYNNTNIQVVVGLDFGTISSGFSSCSVSNEENMCYYDSWSEYFSYSGLNQKMKINTAFCYDESLKWVRLPYYNNGRNRVVELFKSYLGDSPDNLKPKLPFNYEKIISDYLRELGMYIKQEVAYRWVGTKLSENALLVVTIPDEYTEKDKEIMKKCLFDANLIQNDISQNLQFVTESEAAAIYCMKNELQESNLLTAERTFMIVDCGGFTVDLSTFNLIKDNQLQLTGRIRDFCGSKFIDEEFVKFLREKLGTRAINLLIEAKNNEFRNLIKSCWNMTKESFTGENMIDSRLNIYSFAPCLLQYVTKETREIMEKNSWYITIKYNDLKKMFDNIINRIIRLIHIQLSNNQKTCSAMFLVGGFSRNIYLQNRIKKEFHNMVQIISIPDQPMCAIADGAVIYGLRKLKNNENNISNSFTKVLKYTYVIHVNSNWTKDVELNSKISLVNKDTEITFGQTFSSNYKPEPGQSHVKFSVHYTDKDKSQIDESEKLLGVLNVDLPDVHLDDRSIDFGLTFNSKEITVFARNKLNGQKFVTKFYYPIDDDF
ncbi:unnamed protein product [Rhizophagus irregularis]|uniref:Hsp70 family protein n=1 Tax=Rhizophagus irregularis TaxID=588596 RepID=A0A2N1N1G4_9GLOM|nr:hypothetical protein RhiirC2_783155 [Rhizophagus irregularis]CAB4381776.1 unnamed protein product [Rhizophagus irregularis]